MRVLIISFFAAMAFVGCTNSADETGRDSDSLTTNPEAVPDTLCFSRLSGTAGQDTTSLKLIIDGDRVIGDFAHYPYEKDKRVGTINARIDDDLIKGRWTYMQEGRNDTLAVEFKLKGNKLLQKNYTVDSSTGREMISDASVFNIEFDKISCP